MIEDISKLKSPEDWGKHQFEAGLLSWFSWAMLGEQHYLTYKVLIQEYKNAVNELITTYKDVSGYDYGTKEFEVMQKTYFYQPANLFLALSFENFLKGIWIKQNAVILSGKEKLPNLLKTHELNKLANKCALTLSEGEKKFLDALSMFSIWMGKYVIPTNQKENIKFFTNRIDQKFSTISNHKEFDFPEPVITLRSKISEKLNLKLH